MRWRVSPACHPEPERGEPGRSCPQLTPHLFPGQTHFISSSSMPSLTPLEALPPSPCYPGAAPGEAPPRCGTQSDPHAFSPCRAREAPPVQERRLHEPALQGEVAVQRVRHRAALLQEPRARVPCVSAALGPGRGTGTTRAAGLTTGGSVFQLVRALRHPVAG